VVDGRALRAYLDAPVVIKDGFEALRWRERELEQSDWVQPRALHVDAFDPATVTVLDK
jgi:hypothetical protein